MSKLQSAKGYIQKARDIQSNGAKFMLDYKQKHTAAVGEIESNRHLSEEGRRAAKDDVRKKLGVEFLQKSHTLKQEYLANLRKAAAAADAVVFAAVKKPDDESLRRFQADLRALKTGVMLSPNADRSYERLAAFVADINDAYLANIVRDEFSDIAAGIVSSAEGARLKPQLARMFDGLKSNHESDEIVEARGILEAAKEAEARPQLYTGGIVSDAAISTFGREYGAFIDNTDAYFERNVDDKPADYVDPESIAEKRLTSDRPEVSEYAEAVRREREAREAAAEAHRKYTASLDERLQRLTADGEK